MWILAQICSSIREISVNGPVCKCTCSAFIYETFPSHKVHILVPGDKQDKALKTLTRAPKNVERILYFYVSLCPKNHLLGLKKPEKRWLTGAKCAAVVVQDKHVRHRQLSPVPSCMFSITGWLWLWDDGWGQKQALSMLLLRPGMSRARSPAAINLVPRPLKPESNNATALQTKEEIRSMGGRGSGRGNLREERKTSCSRWHQMYLRGSSRGSAERMQSRHERLQTGSEHKAGRVSARRGWANARGRKGESPLPPLDSTWFMWQL